MKIKVYLMVYICLCVFFKFKWWIWYVNGIGVSQYVLESLEKEGEKYGMKVNDKIVMSMLIIYL